MHTQFPPRTAQVDLVSVYLTAHFLSQESQIYSYLFWAAIVTAFLVISSWRHFHLHRVTFVNWYIRWAIIRNKRVSLSRIRTRGRPQRSHPPHFFPSNGTIVGLFLLLILTCILVLVGPDFIAPRQVHYTPDVKPDADEFEPPKSTIYKSLWTSAARAGTLAFAALPLCILLALKSSPVAAFTWSFATQLYFDKLAVFHRWTGRLIWAMTCVHVMLWCIKLGKDRFGENETTAFHLAWSQRRFVYGWLAFILLTILMAVSSKTLRKAHYEAFYILHIVLVPTMLLMCALHHPETGWWAWVASGLWVAERIWRAGRCLLLNGYFASGLHSTVPSKQPKGHVRLGSVDGGAYQYPPLFTSFSRNGSMSDPGLLASSSQLPYRPPAGFAHAELLAGATIRLTYTTTRRISWAAGQHFLVNIPSISRLTSHPFTCCSIFHNAVAVEGEHTLVFLIRAKNGWTKDLWDTVARHSVRGEVYVPGEPPPADAPLPSIGVVMRINIDGPFGSAARVPWGKHSSVLIVAGGSGVSFGLSVLQHLCVVIATQKKEKEAIDGDNQEFQTRRVRFIWLVHEFSHIQWCSSVIRRCHFLLPRSELEVNVFVTKTTLLKNGPTTALPSEPLSLDACLLPPSPRFSQDQTTRRSRRISAGSTDSFASKIESGDELDMQVDEGLQDIQIRNRSSYHHSRDLTNYEGEHEFVIPGEVSLNRRIKREGRVRRARTRKARLLSAVSKGNTNQQPQRRPDRMSIDWIDSSGYESAEERWSHSVSSHHESHHLDELHDPSNAAVSSPKPVQTRGSSQWQLKSENRMGTMSPLRSSHMPESSFSPPNSSPLASTGAFPLVLSPLRYTPSEAQDTADPLVNIYDDRLRLRLEEKELNDVSQVAELTRPGKPKLDRILGYEVDEARGSLLVACCGPTSLNALVRETVASHINPRSKSQAHIELYSEDFEY